MARSNLDRMFWQTATKVVTPLENFSSAALAMAINHDPQPFLRALQGIHDWHEGSGRPAIDLVHVRSVTADTQIYLPNEADRESGYLDLVVTMTDRVGKTAVAWVEVKIDAPLTERAGPTGGQVPRDQLDVYLEHLRVHPDTFIVVLAKRGIPVTDKVTTLTWDDIVATAAVLGQARNVWADLQEFLWAQRVVIPPVRGVEAEDLLPTLRIVDGTVAALWVDPPKPLHWGNRIGWWVKSQLKAWGDAMVTGGPLFWGLRPVGDLPDTWEWLIAITTGNKWEKVWVEPEDLRQAAAAGRLPATWDPSQEHYRGWSLVYSKSRPFMKDEPGEHIADWFDAALRELHEAGLVEPYHRELRAKMQAKLQVSGARS